VKKHFTLFFVYVAVIIAGLSLFLIFHNQKEEPSTSGNSSQQEQGSNSNNDSNNNSSGGSDKDEEVDNTIYATKLTLNCARTIDIRTNSSVEIVGEYLTLIPANSNLKITITAESGRQEDLTFINNVITSKGAGKYRIKFHSLKSKTNELSDTLVVNVKEVVPELVSLKISYLTIGKFVKLDDVFVFDEVVTSATILTDEKINYENKILYANQVGKSCVTIFYNVGMFKFSYSTFLHIKDIPQYVIFIDDVDIPYLMVDNVITVSCEVGSSFFIQYSIKNRDEKFVEQLVVIEIDNEIVATYKLQPPLIKITCLSKGSVNLIITCEDDPESKLKLTINFV